MYTHAHPLVSAVLVIITCSVIIGNTIVERRTQEQAFPAYKPRPSLAEARRHAMMVGTWLGESSIEAGGQRRVLVERFPDGTFRVTFKTQWEEDRAILEQQVGQWGLAGPIYFTITTGWVEGNRIDPTDRREPYFYDAYRVIDLQDDRFEYESFSASGRFVMRRVADDFLAKDL